jgi:hypothetical protein
VFGRQFVSRLKPPDLKNLNQEKERDDNDN